jgi:hypothetical protein
MRIGWETKTMATKMAMTMSRQISMIPMPKTAQDISINRERTQHKSGREKERRHSTIAVTDKYGRGLKELMLKRRDLLLAKEMKESLSMTSGLRFAKERGLKGIGLDIGGRKERDSGKGTRAWLERRSRVGG